MSKPMLITPYTMPVAYTPKHINTTGLPPKYSPYRITPEVDNYFNLLKGLKRRGMNRRESQIQADDNYNIRSWIAQEESRGIDLTEWLVKQGYNRSVRGGSRKRKQKQKKSKKTRRV
jgi:hypothetical protein